MLALFSAGCCEKSLAQQTLTLERCRSLALSANKEHKIAEEKVAETEALRQMALCQFFPTLTANGTYLYNHKNLQLLSDEQQSRINNMGSTLQDNFTNNIVEWASSELSFDPVFLRRIISRIGATNAANDLNAIGNDITDALNIDMTNIFAGAVSVTQPIYMGGKLRSLYRTARLANELAQVQCDKDAEDLTIAVDEAYWRVISLLHKQQLAQQYYDLLTQLSSDVDAMVEAEVATMADQTTVRVKQNEAKMNLTKANIGLSLSRMVLNQICGLPLNSIFIFDEDTELVKYQPLSDINMDEVFANRKEVKMLEISKSIANEGVKGAASTLLPNIGLTGSYAVSNPNFYNGYQKEFGGMLTAGVVVNIPICHPSSFFALKAAKHKQNEVQYQLDDACDKITLQVNKLNYQLLMANEKFHQAQSSLANAEENLRLADESFKSGLISTTELMQAQTAWLSAKTDITDAEIDIRMSYLYLQQAIGNNN